MNLMFDFTAGTSTGSIIAAGLAMPNKKSAEDPVDCIADPATCQPKYFADDLIKIYSEQGDKIFQKYRMNPLIGVACTILALTIFTGIFYYLGTRKYDSKV